MHHHLRNRGWGASQLLIVHIEDNCGEDPGSEVDDGHHCNNKARVNVGDLKDSISETPPALNITESGECSGGQKTPMLTASKIKQKKLRRTPITKASLFLG